MFLCSLSLPPSLLPLPPFPQWQHYLSCSGVPDPSDEKATNTYLTLCEEDSTTGDIRYTLSKITQWLDVSLYTQLC